MGKMIKSKTPTIGVSEMRILKEMTENLGAMLNEDEFTQIILVYNKCMNRLLRENGEE